MNGARKYIAFIITTIGSLSWLCGFSQNEAPPKLVVGIVIDQMRWDYLRKFYPLFSPSGGFRRMLDKGYSCDQTFIPYTPSVTACGHTCVYTGSVPAVHGITGNSWWDNQQMRSVYCTEDKNVKNIGSSNTEEGSMSPVNMLTTTVCDELKIATNFKSKVIGIALKDRGAILPAGHSADAAYWYDGKAGKFISSSFYMDDLPKWVKNFNARNITDSFYALGWKPILPEKTYHQFCTEDVMLYEGRPFNRDMLGFPYDLTSFTGRDFSKISTTPYGNNLTIEMAKSALLNEKLGTSSSTDFLAISFSSPDYIGHAFGPDSWEMLDNYIRLDAELGKLFDFLDTHVGRNTYTTFLTADHAVAHIPGFLKNHKLPNGFYESAAVLRSVNTILKNSFGIDKLIVSYHNYQFYLNHQAIDSAGINEYAVMDSITNYLKKQDAIASVWRTKEMMQSPIPQKLREKLANGFFPQRCGDLQVILKPGYIDGSFTGTTHGVWYTYDTHIPLLWYGNGINKGHSNKEVYMTDIAPTISALLGIQMPNGSIGKVIEGVLKQ